MVVAVALLLTAPVALGAAGDFSAAGTSPETAGDGPFSVARGDFNGDGKPDLASANVNSDDVRASACQRRAWRQESDR
jgi:hypothetical protein